MLYVSSIERWLLVCTVLMMLRLYRRRWKSWVNVPTIGPSDPILSYITAIRTIRNGSQILQKAYDEYRGRIFKIPSITRWTVMLSGHDLVNELLKASEDVFSMRDSFDVRFQTSTLLGPDVLRNPYHNEVISQRLTRSLPSLISDIAEEVGAAYHSQIGDRKQWISVIGLATMTRVTAQATSRVFAGLPLCRDASFVNLIIQFSLDIAIGAKMIDLFPGFAKPLVARCIVTLNKRKRQISHYLAPVIQGRLDRLDNSHSGVEGEPNDMLTWLIEGGSKEQRQVHEVIKRFLIVSFAGTHSTSMTFTHALFCLASMPDYIEPLRKEIEESITEHGWSKDSLQQCIKLDSFIKESQRLHRLSLISTSRVARIDYTFLDGTFIPKGTLVQCVAQATQTDEDAYGPTAKVFDGFRFSRMRENATEHWKYSMVSTNLEHLVFGHGKNSCPGRFFASYMVKIMMAQLILNYDVRFARSRIRPPDRYIGMLCSPNDKAELLFRKRSTC